MTALYDFDDTLIFCSKYYRDAYRVGGEYISNLTGGVMSPDAVIKVIADIDLAVARDEPMFRKDRLADSFVNALRTLSPQHSSIDVQAVRDAANSVYRAEYALRDGALELLDLTRNLGYRNVLVTKGDAEVQRYKIEKHGLAQYFANINIVRQKNVQTWADILVQEKANTRTSFVIGDSLKDDIAPCNTLGVRTVHISTEDAWAYNTVDGVTPDFHVDSLGEFHAMLAR